LRNLEREDARKKTWRNCVKDDMGNLGVSLKDVRAKNKQRRRIKWATG